MEPEIYPLEADGIRKNFGNLCLLRDIYVRVEPCAVTALLGRNGVGKSTLMKIIYGIERSDGVSVRHGGKYVDRPYKRTGLIRYLPQYPFLPENIKLIRLLKLYGTTVDRLAPFISDLNDRLHKTLGELSVGQKRMLETVLVLTSPVKFVFLDEPFLGLAPLHIERMKQLIVSEAAHKGMLISDHSYKHVLEISDFCYLLRSDGVLSPVKDIPGDLKKWGYIP